MIPDPTLNANKRIGQEPPYVETEKAKLLGKQEGENSIGLPNEIIEKIFEYVPWTDLKNVRLSCKNFYANTSWIVKDSSRNLFLEDTYINNTLRCINYLNLIERIGLVLKKFSQPEIQTILDSRPLEVKPFSFLKEVLVVEGENKVLNVDKTIKSIVLARTPFVFKAIVNSENDPNLEKFLPLIDKVFWYSKLETSNLVATRDEQTCLNWCLDKSAGFGLVGVIKRILSLGGIINCNELFVDASGNESFPPLTRAADMGKIEALEYMLDQVREEETLNDFAEVPTTLEALIYYVKDNQNLLVDLEAKILRIIDKLIARKASPFEGEFEAPIFTAAESGSFKIFKRFCDFNRHAAITIQDDLGDSLLHACKGEAMTDYLLDLGANGHLTNNNGETPLITAINEYDFTKAETLIKRTGSTMTQEINIQAGMLLGEQLAETGNPICQQLRAELDNFLF